MRVDDVIARLDKVRPTTRGRWVARCPAHDDGHPSLLVSEGEGGKVGMHCFAGCDIYSIVSAIGFEVSDLYPERLAYSKPNRRPWRAADLIHLLDREMLVMALVTCDKVCNGTVSGADAQRLLEARMRIAAIVEAL